MGEGSVGKYGKDIVQNWIKKGIDYLSFTVCNNFICACKNKQGF